MSYTYVQSSPITVAIIDNIIKYFGSSSDSSECVLYNTKKKIEIPIEIGNAIA